MSAIWPATWKAWAMRSFPCPPRAIAIPSKPFGETGNSFRHDYPMTRILIDCERTKHPHTGLLHFCLQLRNALIRHVDRSREELSCDVPRRERSSLCGGEYNVAH